MSMNLAAMYDKAAAAEQARRELLANGLREGDVDVITSEAELRTRSGGAEGYFQSLFDTKEQRDYIECFTEGVRRGAAVVSVRDADDGASGKVQEILNRYGPVDLDMCHRDWNLRGRRDTRAGDSAGAAAGAASAAQRGASSSERQAEQQAGERIPIVEEQLQVGKRQVQDGGARIVSRVRSQPVEEQVSLRDERAAIERHKVDRPATDADLRAAQSGSIEVQETHEEPVVRKTAHVTEEVTVGKEVRDRTATVRDDVKHTEVEVQRRGRKPDGNGSTPRRS